MSLAPNEPDLVWHKRGRLNFLTWRGGFLFYRDKEPSAEEMAVYTKAALEVEAQGLNPKILPGRSIFSSLISAPLWEIRQRDASSQR